MLMSVLRTLFFSLIGLPVLIYYYWKILRTHFYRLSTDFSCFTSFNLKKWYYIILIVWITFFNLLCTKMSRSFSQHLVLWFFVCFREMNRQVFLFSTLPLLWTLSLGVPIHNELASTCSFPNNSDSSLHMYSCAASGPFLNKYLAYCVLLSYNNFCSIIKAVFELMWAFEKCETMWFRCSMEKPLRRGFMVVCATIA